MHLSASGRCVLSLQSPNAIESYLAHAQMSPITPWSLTDPSELKAKFLRCREMGFALVKQEASPGMVTLACPVTNGTDVVAGVSVHAPLAGFDEEQFLSDVLTSVVSVSQALSQA